MIIGIDASRAFLPRRTGIEEYAYQLIKHLRQELAGERVILYTRQPTVGSGGTDNEQLTTNNQQQIRDNKLDGKSLVDFALPEEWEVKELWGPRFWTQGALALEMLIHPPDVLLVPAHTIPWRHPKRSVVVVHGLEYEFCPEAYSRWERFYMRFSIRNSCRWASNIVAVSENTKRDLVSLYGVPAEKIRVVYEGVPKFQAPNSKFQISSKFQIPKPYFLFIGRIETRKNVARIIEAFGVFKKEHGMTHKLVLAGKPGFGYEEIQNKIRQLADEEDFSKDIVEVGYVSEEEKWDLLCGADAFLFPSLYEGFGLPVLEAQSVGVPVLTSNVSSLSEVAGDGAVVLVDPLRVEHIAKGMGKIALESGLRSAIIERGFRNVARFSWKKCAKEVAEVLLNRVF